MILMQKVEFLTVNANLRWLITLAAYFVISAYHKWSIIVH
jgi:hypothetical protein